MNEIAEDLDRFFTGVDDIDWEPHLEYFSMPDDLDLRRTFALPLELKECRHFHWSKNKAIIVACLSVRTGSGELDGLPLLAAHVAYELVLLSFLQSPHWMAPLNSEMAQRVV
jgi:hypothetical protein